MYGSGTLSGIAVAAGAGYTKLQLHSKTKKGWSVSSETQTCPKEDVLTAIEG